MNALFWAALSRRTDTLRALVAKARDVNAGQRERTALFWPHTSATRTRAPCGEGGTRDARDSHGWTALMSAADLATLTPFARC